MGALSRYNVVNYFAMDICQPITPPLKFIGELLMINAQEVHQSSLKIVNMNRIPDEGYSQTRQWHHGYTPFLPQAPAIQIGKTSGMMISAVIVHRELTL